MKEFHVKIENSFRIHYFGVSPKQSGFLSVIYRGGGHEREISNAGR
jgi:hypothetical protein